MFSIYIYKLTIRLRVYIYKPLKHLLGVSIVPHLPLLGLGAAVRIAANCNKKNYLRKLPDKVCLF